MPFSDAVANSANASSLSSLARAPVASPEWPRRMVRLYMWHQQMVCCCPCEVEKNYLLWGQRFQPRSGGWLSLMSWYFFSESLCGRRLSGDEWLTPTLDRDQLSRWLPCCVYGPANMKLILVIWRQSFMLKAPSLSMSAACNVGYRSLVRRVTGPTFTSSVTIKWTLSHDRCKRWFSQAITACANLSPDPIPNPINPNPLTLRTCDPSD